MPIPRWAYIPESTIDQENKEAEADQWYTEQLRKLADDWALRQRELLADNFPLPETPTIEEYRSSQIAKMPSPTAGVPDVSWQDVNEGLRENVRGYAGAADLLGKGLEWTEQNVDAPVREAVARGGERLGAAVRGEDWQSMPSAFDTPDGMGLAESWKQREVAGGPLVKAGMELLASPSNIVPVEAVGKLAKGAKSIVPKIDEFVKSDIVKQASPGLGVEDVSKVAPPYDVARTSVRQVPALLHRVPWRRGGVNVDIGGGRFDEGTNVLREQGVENLVLDPFNRSPEHNAAITTRLSQQPADTATAANVLNVIENPEARLGVIKQTAELTRPGGKVYFSVYEGNKSGIGKATGLNTWQENRRLASYLAEVRRVFPDARVQGDYIVAVRPEALPADVTSKSFPLFSAPEVGGGVVGALAYQDDPSLSAEENAQRRLLFAAGGAGLGHLGRRLGSKSRLGGTVEDVSQGSIPPERSLVPVGQQGLTPPGQQGLTVPNTALGPADNIERVVGEIVPPTQPPGGLLGAGDSFSPKPPGKAKEVGNQYFWNRVRNAVESQGPVGKELGRRIWQWRDTYQRMHGDWTSRMPTVAKLSNSEYDNFINVAEAKAAPINANVQQAASEWAEIRLEVERQAQASGLDIGHIENYFPRMYKSGYLEEVLDIEDKSQWLSTLNHMIKEGRAKDLPEAERLLYSLRNKVHTRKASNLEIAREANLPGYRRDKGVLGEYLDEASKRISYAQQFGAKHELAENMWAKIHQQGYDKRGEVQQLFAKATEGVLYGFREQGISNKLRGVNVLTKLGLGALTNATQSVNTATVAGAFRTMKLAPKAAASKEAHDFAVRIGVVTDQALNAVREGTGFSGKAMAIGAPGFNTVERFNRTLAALAGREMVQELAEKSVKGDKSAMQGLRDMRLDPDTIIQRGGRLSQDEIDRAARSIVERTQFLVDPQDLPSWASSPWGRVIMQFKTFGYNQTAFMGKEVINPALKGNAGPLATFLLFGAAAGTALNELNDIIKGREGDDDTLAGTLNRAYQRIGALGIVGELLTGFTPPGTKYSSGERFAMQATGTLLGPSAGTAMQGLAAVPSALGGKPEALQRWALRQVPVAGPIVSNRAVPYQDQKPRGKGLSDYVNQNTGQSTNRGNKFNKYLGTGR